MFLFPCRAISLPLQTPHAISNSKHWWFILLSYLHCPGNCANASCLLGLQCSGSIERYLAGIITSKHLSSLYIVSSGAFNNWSLDPRNSLSLYLILEHRFILDYRWLNTFCYLLIIFSNRKNTACKLDSFLSNVTICFLQLQVSVFCPSFNTAATLLMTFLPWYF